MAKIPGFHINHSVSGQHCELDLIFLSDDLFPLSSIISPYKVRPQQLNIITLQGGDVRVEAHIHVKDMPFFTPIKTPELPKARSDKELVRDAINVGAWFPLNQLADILDEEGDHNAGLSWGLRWLIDHRKYPRQMEGLESFGGWGWATDAWYGQLDLLAPIPYSLPAAPSVKMGLTPTTIKFHKTIEEAFLVAAQAVYDTRNEIIVEQDVGTGTDDGEDDTNAELNDVNLGTENVDYDTN